MTIELSPLGRLRVAVETGTSAFAVDQSASPSNFIDLPIVEGSLAVERNEELLDPATMQTMLDDYSLQVRGVKSTGVSFSSILASTGTAYTGANAVPTDTTWALARVMKTVMGGLAQGSSPAAGAITVVSAGSTTSSINTAGGAANQVLVRGGVVGCVVNGRVEAREINTIGAANFTVKMAFSGIPSNASQVYTGTTFYLTENPLNSLQFLYDGMEAYEKYVHAGLQGGFDLDITAGQLPKINVKLAGAYWAKLTNGAIAAGTPTLFGPAVNMDSEFLVRTVGSTVRNVVHCASETWSPNIQYLDVKSTAGVNTILRKRRNRGRVVSGEFTVYNDSSGFDFDAAATARTELGMYRQIGSTAGSIVLLSAPNCQIKVPQKADASGLDAKKVSWMARNDTDVSATAGDVTSSAFKIHML